MTQLTEDEQVFKRVEEKVKRAIFDYGLIQTGDRVLIGLSGGKDSLALVELLGRRSKIFNPRFEVVVAHVIMRNIPYHSDLDYLRQQVEARIREHPGHGAALLRHWLAQEDGIAEGTAGGQGACN